MVLDSQRWKCVESVPPILFSVEGLSAVRGREPGHRGWLTVAEGVVQDVRNHHVVLEDDVRLAYVLPGRVDLRPLLGCYVKVTLNDEPAAAGPRAQTLTIADETGRPRVFARFGPAGHVCTVGSSRVRAALSQRPDGPMTVGTDKLQYVVHVGEHVRMREPAGDFVVHFVARTVFDYVTYVVTERALWREARR
ncbi:MAG TPA: hypothetical protein VIF09_14925 [Polyangiaceae bacterium]|jgi:hypothetical protein